jgi:uncharacterized protein (TIGR02145 family)
MEDILMRRKSYLLAFVVIIALIGFGIADLNADYVCGDANGDGLLNVSDAVFIINHVFVGGPAPDPNCCANCPATVTDYDGNVYQAVLIGNQCWMMENLKVTHYRNGEEIPYVEDGFSWGEITTGAFCTYYFEEDSTALYGRLYNWYAVDDSRGIAPEGWHVPTDAEWKQLEMYLGMSQGEADAEDWRGTDEGGKLKEVGTMHWSSPNTGATNESGFTAIPAGARFHEGSFASIHQGAFFWSSTAWEPGPFGTAWYRVLSYDNSQVYRTYYKMKGGYSVRCVKDQ